MKKKPIVWLLAAMLTVPSAGFAMKHMDNEDHGKMEMKEDGHGGMQGMDHGDMKEMDHHGMQMGGTMMMLGNEEVDGINGMAHLNDVQEAMAKMGMTQTHHLMIAFKDSSSGEKVESGVVAVKIEGPDGKVTDPIKLMGMQGHFGADITLDQKGTYTFMFGTKLADGKTRQFKFSQTLE